MVKSGIRASVVIAVRNEEKTIGEVIESLINQNYPKNKYEIIFSDGRSTDKTREIIKRYAASRKPQVASPKIILLDNPSKDSGSGRNIGIKKARGEYIVQLSGHTIADKDLLKVLIGRLEKAPEDVAAVGCMHRTPEDAPFLEKVFGNVIGSYLGGFGTSQIQPTKEQFVDSLSFVAFRKKVLLEVGLNDTKFRIGQDAELNIRIRKAGYKFLYTPKTYVLYHKRATYFGFARQMYYYGYSRARMILKHPDTAKIFYLAPSIFVLTSIFLILGSWVSGLLQLLLALFLIIYFGTIASSSIRSSRSFTFALAMFFAYIVEHVSYGVGFLIGAVRGFK